MTIRQGERLPSATFRKITADGITTVSSKELLANRKVAIFGLPGAYTPVCSANHLPGYANKATELREAGFDEVVCVSVNDPFVMDAWTKAQGVDGKITMLCDTDGSFTKAIGLVANLGEFGLHDRSERYSMVVTNGVVEKLAVEKTVFEHSQSSAESMLSG